MKSRSYTRKSGRCAKKSLFFIFMVNKIPILRSTLHLIPWFNLHCREGRGMSMLNQTGDGQQKHNGVNSFPLSF